MTKPIPIFNAFPILISITERYGLVSWPVVRDQTRSSMRAKYEWANCATFPSFVHKDVSLTFSDFLV